MLSFWNDADDDDPNGAFSAENSVEDDGSSVEERRPAGRSSCGKRRLMRDGRLGCAIVGY